MLLPAFPIAVVAAVRNRRALALTAAGVAVALLVLAAPIAFPGHRPAVAADATRLRISFANLFRENQDPSAAAAVMAHDADVVAVVELNPVMATHLEAAAAGRYRYQLAQPHVRLARAWRSTPASPSSSADIRPIGSRLGLEAHLDVDGQPVRLFVVHPFPPIFNGRLSARVGRRASPPSVTRRPAPARRRSSSGTSTPAAGTRRSAGCCAAACGTRTSGSATASRRRGRTTGRRHPFVRLDHALVGPGVIPTAVDDIDVPGSDHRGFVVDVAVNP